MSILVEPFSYDFFRTGIAAAALAGALCGAVGVYVVLRGMSYIGHGLSHAIFGGAVASFVAKINFYVGAGIWGVVSALMIHAVARRRKIGADAAIGVVTTASFAVGIALISRYRSFTRNFEAALFGSVLGVETLDVLVIALVSLGVATIIFLRYRDLVFMTFDPEVAAISGVAAGRLDALFSLILASTILATMRVLGVLLIAAALVTPAATARMLTDRFARMLWISTAIGAATGAAGMYVSYFLDIASGPAIVLIGAAAFLLAFSLTGQRRYRLKGTAIAPSEG
jgi:ABC-type Mn2+/Zn2+ transport system permease subunit